MASNLTERLAAAGVPTCRTLGYCSGCYEFRHTVAREAANILPLFLSEPELVAGLAPEVKREVLRTLLGERVVEMSREGGTWRRVADSAATESYWDNGVGYADFIALVSGAGEVLGIPVVIRRSVPQGVAMVVNHGEAVAVLPLPPSPAPMEGRSNE